ncbi:MAG: bifunctional diaminohydroxyphosphoribosylaminopyrimidine deaminase/5-amino-6-(5-phosphoribosylamino)uracil reductase RibD [Spirochaetota bacterium]
MTNADDRAALSAAYEQAVLAAGNSDPNPSVGAVITDPRGTIIARGYTQRAGYAHAERHALAQLSQKDLSNHTMYVTLEPCCHHGRTPPCVDAIVEHNIGRVVIAERDFAAEVQGRSVALMRQQGIEVTEWQSDDFRREKWFTTGPFFFSRKFRRPRVLLKWAQTADGSLAPVIGKSGPISGGDAAFLTATLRFWSKLTVASPGTVQVDQPRLTVRAAGEIPDLSRSGLSAYAWELLRRQYGLACEQPDAEALLKRVRPPESLFLLPDSSTASPAPKPDNKQNRRAKVIPRAEWRQDFSATWHVVLAEILADGFNSLLLEAGPYFSDLIIGHDCADAIAVYRSHARHDTELWGSKGRSNRLSVLLAEKEKPDLPGFTLLEFARLDTDDFLLYVRTDTL